MLVHRRRNMRGASFRRAKILLQEKDRTLAEETDYVTGVSGRYASALFALAQERNETASVAESLQ